MEQKADFHIDSAPYDWMVNLITIVYHVRRSSRTFVILDADSFDPKDVGSAFLHGKYQEVIWSVTSRGHA